MTFSIFLKILALGLLEPVMDQNLYYTGMKSTSATFASAMCNVLPALTFLMAYIFRLEKVNIKKTPSQAKVAGTLVTVAGAMVMTIYKGPIIEMPWSRGGSHINGPKTDAVGKDWIKGSLMLTTGCFCWACFIILQAITLRTYPAELSLTAFICLAGAVEGTVVALAIERGNTAIWSIGWNAKLFAAIYSGIFCSGIAYYIQGVIMKKRGPVFVTAFSPLSMIIVAILGSFILKEEISLGRILGAIVIVIGLYFVVWGKSKDSMISSPQIDERITTPNLPTAAIDSKKTVPNEFISIGVSMPEIRNGDPH
ncbi:WAT1-related protein At2g39510-like [Magnolia sinica]|uniref:WAT1-related protein At2g39510-like n=1 Tax=Magnolia sinica TaxID=86752 RepID=UPI00265A255F|nr:WAT1-related protein At2g39510-like [Magnolia sinica]